MYRKYLIKTRPDVVGWTHNVSR